MRILLRDIRKPILGAMAFACALCLVAAMAPSFLDGSRAGVACKAAQAGSTGLLFADSKATSLFGLGKQPTLANTLRADTAKAAAKASAAPVVALPGDRDIAALVASGQLPSSGFASQVEELLQYPELPAGCEPVSLTIALRSMGYDLALTDITDYYLNYEGDDEAANAYMGSPYESGGSLPPAIVDAGNAYLSEQASSWRAYDMSGTGFETLQGLVQLGYPVLIWTTMYLDDPWFYGEYLDDDVEWYYNEHCVVLYGINGADAYVSDPLEGLVTRDLSEFQRIYEECGSMAIAIA